MNRLYIIGNFKFPRSGATSNYVQYFGCALVRAGYQVHIISRKNTEFNDNTFKNMTIHEIVKSKGKMRGYYDFYTGMADKTIKVLRNEKVGSNDCVIIYSMRPFFVKRITDYCHKNGVKVGNIVTELFEKKDFTHSYYYKKYEIMNNSYIPKGDFILPISTFIRNFFSKYNVKQLVLPILADIEEYQYCEKSFEKKKKFIFPGNGKVKDSLEEMIAAISFVLTEYNFDVEFHFCGLKKEYIDSLINSDKVREKVIIHDWLKYDELIKLYMKMDYLLLARDNSQMCRANFPSKVPELMTYGVIPVASIVGDYTEYYLVDNVNSILFNGYDKDSIAKAIVRACNITPEDEKRLSSKAYEMVKNKLDFRNWDDVLKDFLEN